MHTQEDSVSARRVRFAWLLAALACALGLLVGQAALPARAWADDAAGTAVEATGGALESGSYYLAEDVTLSSNLTVASGVTATLDLAGYTLTGTSSGPAIKVASGGTLTITDTSEAGTGAVVSSYDCLENSGTTAINGGTFTCTSSSNYAIINYAGTLTISETDAAVVVTGTKGAVGVNAGTVTINGGTFFGTKYYALYVTGSSVVTINGGTFDSSNSSGYVVYHAYTSGSITINGGTFEGYLTGSISTSSQLASLYDIVGGAFCQYGSTFIQWINANSVSVYQETNDEDAWNAYPYVYVGTNEEIQALLSEYYESYGDTDSCICVWAGEANLSGLYGLEIVLDADYASYFDGTISLTVDGVSVTASTTSGEYSSVTIRCRATLNGETTYYETLQDAIDGSEAGATVSPLVDIELSSAVSVASDDTLTIDLAGHALTVESSVTSAVISSAGALTITDSEGAGSLTAATVVEATAGTVSITGGCYAGALSENGGSIEVSGGYFSSAVGTDYLASGYSSATALSASEDCAIDTTTYGYTVSPVSLEFLGGSLRMDYTDDDGSTIYTKTSLRFGYTLTTSASGWSVTTGSGADGASGGCALSDGTTSYALSWSWGYGAGTSGSVSSGTVSGVYYTALDGGGLRTNMVATGISSSNYGKTVNAQLTVSYVNSDGVTVTTADSVRSRTVAQIAESIEDSTKASDAEKAYAEGVLAAYNGTSE